MNILLAFYNLSKEILSAGGIDGKILLVLAYLRIFASFIGDVRISIVWLVQNIGYKPKSGHGNITDQIKQILYWLRNSHAIEFDDPKSTTDQMRIRLNMEHPYFNAAPPFVQIDNEELEKITNCQSHHKDWMMTIFLIMKGKMFYNPRDQTYGVAYPSLQQLHSEAVAVMPISLNSVIKVLAELVEVGLLRTYSVGNYIDSRFEKPEVRAFPNFYTVGNQEIDPEECNRIAKESLAMRGINVERFIPHAVREVQAGGLDIKAKLPWEI